MILVVDFGSQTAHLIARRIKDIGAPVRLALPHEALAFIEKEKPKGIIFSGGPSSVYQKGAPTIDKRIFNLGIPLLAICYGFQLTAYMLGGKVVSGKKEYGPATLTLKSEARSTKFETNSKIQDTNDKKSFGFRYSNFEFAKDLPKSFVVWMSHGDEIVTLPKGFEVIGSTEHVPYAFAVDKKRNITGLLFHPEVEHTENGLQIMSNFIKSVYSSSDPAKPESREVFSSRQARTINIEAIKQSIQNTVGDSYVIGAVSGGVDSTVAGLLTAQTIGERFIPVYVENGLMRQGTAEHVQKIFKKHQSRPIVVDSVGETLSSLRGITDSEQKRKIIGALYIEKFEQQMDKLQKSGKNVRFLLQGTIYSDVIESGVQRSPAEASAKEDKRTKHADKIKSHHNVGGLPKRLKLKLLEPLRGFYKDEVREIGKRLGLPGDFIWKQVFPGPGYAVRIRGEVTRDRLSKAKQADEIVLQEIEKAGHMRHVYMSFPVLTGASSTAVKGDGRFFGEVIALRIIESRDVMTATWSRLPYDLLQRISSRIVNEVPGISRVVYDITTKPPATMEWE